MKPTAKQKGRSNPAPKHRGRQAAESAAAALVGGVIAGPAGVAIGAAAPRLVDAGKDRVGDRSRTKGTRGRRRSAGGVETDLTPVKPRPKRILLPLDFSEPSKRVTQLAREWMKFFGAHLYVLHVVEPVPFMTGFPAVPIPLSDREVEEKAKAALERLAARAFPERKNVSLLVRRGKAYDEIVAAARNLKIDLIIIPTHGHTGLGKILLGGTAERVVRHAPCAVLTVRQHARQKR